MNYYVRLIKKGDTRAMLYLIGDYILKFGSYPEPHRVTHLIRGEEVNEKLHAKPLKDTSAIEVLITPRGVGYAQGKLIRFREVVEISTPDVSLANPEE